MENSCVSHQNVSFAVFDNCGLVLFGLGENLVGVAGLFAISWHVWGVCGVQIEKAFLTSGGSILRGGWEHRF